MKNIITFGGSNSKKSINKQLAKYTASLLQETKITLLDLNDYPLPIYGIDIEEESGVPENANKFLEEIKKADGIIVSLAEHNGNYTVAFKNLVDWMSRIEKKVWQNKPVLLLSTSPGGRGGTSVMQIAINNFPHLGANVIANFSLPNFNDNFKEGKIVTDDFNIALSNMVAKLQKAL